MKLEYWIKQEMKLAQWQYDTSSSKDFREYCAGKMAILDLLKLKINLEQIHL